MPGCRCRNLSESRRIDRSTTPIKRRKRLELKAACVLQARNDLSQKANDKKVASRQKNGQRGVQDNARGIDIDVTEGAAKTCYSH